MPKEVPPLASEPSQRSALPVMEVQKAARVVPEVPKMLRVPPPTARLVLEAVVEKKLVVVALVPVARLKVKFCSVEEPVTKRSPELLIVVVAVAPIESELPAKMPAKELVEVA